MRFGRRKIEIEIPEDSRPLGSVSWADPCTSGMTERIHTFNPHEYESLDNPSQQTGIRSGPGINSPAAATWHEHEQYEAKLRRRGVSREGADE